MPSVKPGTGSKKAPKDKKPSRNPSSDGSCGEADTGWSPPVLSRGASAASLHRTHSSGNLSANSTSERFTVKNGSHLQSGRIVPLSMSAGLQDVISEEQDTSFWTYWAREVTTTPKELKKDFLRETERDKVYNTLLKAPLHFERFIWISLIVCLDCLLALFTVLPYRCIRDMFQRNSIGLKGNELYDMICFAILSIGAYILLNWIPPSTIYFGMKDITSEFLKLSLIHVALYITDQILSNFGVDVLEALSGTCTMFCMSEVGLGALVADSLLAMATIWVHSLVIMCSAMVWYVAMASSGTSVIGFLIVSNFGEIKSTVMKRVDPSKLFVLSCQDVVERFHLVIGALFIFVEDMGQNSTYLPRMEMVWTCTMVLFSESVVDIVKHAVLGKFSDIRPGVYREFLRDLCQKIVEDSSHSRHKFIQMEPLGPGVLVLRIFISAWLIWFGADVSVFWWMLRIITISAVVLMLFAAKMALGFWLRKSAVWYVAYFEQNHGRARTPRRESIKRKNL